MQFWKCNFQFWFTDFTFRFSHDNVVIWMPWDLTDDMSTLVQVMAWRRQASSHHLSQYWLSSLSPYGVTRPQRVKRPLMAFKKNPVPECMENDPYLSWFQIPHSRTFVLGYEWWRHQMETFSALLALWAGNSPVPGEFLAQRPVTRSFDVFFDLRLNKHLSKQSLGWWFETPSRSLWRHSSVDGFDTVPLVDPSEATFTDGTIHADTREEHRTGALSDFWSTRVHQVPGQISGP